MSRSRQKGIVSYFRHLTPISSRSSKGQVRQGRLTSHFPRKPAASCAKKCDATYVIQADQSKSRWNTGSAAGGGKTVHSELSSYVRWVTSGHSRCNMSAPPPESGHLDGAIEFFALRPPP